MGVAKRAGTNKSWPWILTLAGLLPLACSAALAAAPPPTHGQHHHLGASPSSALDPSTQLGVREWFGEPGPPQPKRAWQREKNPKVAMFSSLLVPGLGQLYNERGLWALVAAGVQFGFIADIIIQQRLTNPARRGRIRGGKGTATGIRGPVLVTPGQSHPKFVASGGHHALERRPIVRGRASLRLRR